MERKKLFYSPRSIVVALVCVGAFLSATMLLSSRASSPQTERRQERHLLEIKYATSALKVVAIEPVGPDHIKLTFRNESDKNITAFSRSTGANSKVDTEMIRDERVMAPGDTRVEQIPHPRPRGSSSESPRSTTILAVVFDDRTGDGVQWVIRGILDRRIGEKRQTARIRPLLQEILDSSDSDLAATLESVKSRIRNLPKDVGPNESSYVEIGLHNAKEGALMDLENLERFTLREADGTDHFREQLVEKIERSRRIARKL